MRTCFLALGAALLFAATTLAQPPDTLWTHPYGGAGIDEAFGVCAVSDGGFAVVGRSRSFGTNFDIMATRVDAMGDVIWTRTFGGPGYDHATGVRETADGGFLIVGYTDSFGAGNYDIYVVRTNAVGDTLWTRTYGTDGFEYGYALVVTTDGGFAVAGAAVATGQSLNMALIKADANGNVQWQRTYGGTNVDEAYSLELTSDNGFLLGGRSIPPGNSFPDLYAVRTHSNGDTVWTRRVGTTEWEEGVGAIETMDGGVIIGGWRISGNNSDFYIVKLNANGTQAWSHTFGGANLERATVLKRTSDGGCILGGYTGSAGAGGLDFYMIKFDTDGDTMWTLTNGGYADDLLYSIAITSDGGYLAAGASNSYGSGNLDFWLVRLPGYAGVAGYTRDSVTNDPLPYVWVGAVGQPNRVRSDSHGYYVLTLPPAADYDIITFGQCVGRDTLWQVPVFEDSLTPRDLQLSTPDGVVPLTSVNIVAPNHTTAVETLIIFNRGLGILDFAFTVDMVQPPSDWLSVEPMAGAVAPGDSALVAVIVTADTTDDGTYDYYGALTVHMNSCPDSAVHVDVLATILDANDPGAALPTAYTLSAYPNPFNPVASLTFSLPREERVRLAVFDVLGREVRRVADAPFAAGVHRVTFDGAALPSGLYIARLQTETTALSQKLMLMK